MGARGVHAAPLGPCWTAEKDMKVSVCKYEFNTAIEKKKDNERCKKLRKY